MLRRHPRGSARRSLAGRGLLDRDGLTGEGRRLRAHIERRTDALATYALSHAEFAELDALLRPPARALVPSAVPQPNPVGVPRP
ncbi:hypothetical protein FPZ12_039455 [Amycolatopsis acidicola]|uniref:MarR family transcriptional regulator n=1 Tax=Amycolatopsis acidicola TaxID=2596893 RepID=A0A5N0UNZ7_9PSEU|nr:hypothetical protein [Amycolatopsis acidicola]KAA9151217.1 hypothetical protein FPZ12_039455 [Amycolatopsis acidicola]